jgi:Calcium-dependent channel, 7TM region, putative phosphate
MLAAVDIGLVLKVFLAVLPMLLTFMNKKAGMQSLAEIDYGVFTKYFIFQVSHYTKAA